MWISLYFLCEQLGVVTGQGASALSVYLTGTWKYAFLAETGLLLSVVMLLYLSIPVRYYQGQAEDGV